MLEPRNNPEIGWSIYGKVVYALVEKMENIALYMYSFEQVKSTNWMRMFPIEIANLVQWSFLIVSISNIQRLAISSAFGTLTLLSSPGC